MVRTTDLPGPCPSCKNESQNLSNHPRHTGTHPARKTNPQLAGAVPDDRSKQLRARHTQAMDAVLHLYEDLIIPGFRSQRAPMPIVVLQYKVT